MDEIEERTADTVNPVNPVNPVHSENTESGQDAPAADITSADAPVQGAAGAESPVPAPAEPDGGAGKASLSPAELADLRAAYPDADVEQDMNDPVFRGLVRGEVKPTLRQVYELFHREQLTAAAVGSAVSDALAREIPAAVASATASAVAEAEERLLDDIRLRGTRPSENGVGTPCAVASHPSVDRLTRSERAQLARRAEHGERIRL